MGDLKSLPGDRPGFPSRAAYPCYREISGESGGAVVWFVLMPDGFLIDCGRKWGQARATILADMINTVGFEKIDKESLEAFQ